MLSVMAPSTIIHPYIRTIERRSVNINSEPIMMYLPLGGMEETSFLIRQLQKKDNRRNRQKTKITADAV
jgi:hypothetical protein